MQENEICDICYAEYKGRTVSGYIKYILAKVKEKYETKSYRVYVTEVLKHLAEHNDIKVDESWCDLIDGNVKADNEAETALTNFYSDLRGGD